MMILISAERSTLDEATNGLRMERLACRLRREGLAFERGRGAWGGRTETVLAVTCPAASVPVVVGIAEAFEQEAVLWVDALGDAALYWLADRSTEPLGEWREVSEAEAVAAGEWTEIGGRYWRAG